MYVQILQAGFQLEEKIIPTKFSNPNPFCFEESGFITHLITILKKKNSPIAPIVEILSLSPYTYQF